MIRPISTGENTGGGGAKKLFPLLATTCHWGLKPPANRFTEGHSWLLPPQPQTLLPPPPLQTFLSPDKHLSIPPSASFPPLPPPFPAFEGWTADNGGIELPAVNTRPVLPQCQRPQLSPEPGSTAAHPGTLPHPSTGEGTLN